MSETDKWKTWNVWWAKKLWELKPEDVSFPEENFMMELRRAGQGTDATLVSWAGKLCLI